MPFLYVIFNSADYVMKDYENMLRNGQDAVKHFMNDVVGQFLSKNNTNNNYYESLLKVDHFYVLDNLTSSNVVPLVR